MTSFSSSFSNIPSYSSFSSSSSSPLVVTREEFNAFHKIDRTLFSRLVFGLNRDMSQSFEVIGFLFLLEQTSYARNLIAYLVSLPDAFIDAVANEIVVCLSFLYNQEYSTFFIANNSEDHSIIPLIIRLTGGRLTLRFIHQNRKDFLIGLRKNVNDICNRAFEDISVSVERYNKEKHLALEREKIIEEMKKIRVSVQQETPNRLSVQQATVNRLSVQQERVSTPPLVEDEANKMAEEEEVVVEADDRTVFLTFSKGYRISEEEVRVYFTRRYGEVIETVEMQEVEENEQPLYARMVLKVGCAFKIEEIVSERSRNKFTINGKHVWARKYVRKNPNSSASPSSSHI